MTRRTKNDPPQVQVGQANPEAAKLADERHKKLYGILEDFRDRYQHGEHEMLERALAAAIKHAAPLPQWLADELLKVFRASETGRQKQTRETREKDRMRSIIVALIQERDGLTKEKAFEEAARTIRGDLSGSDETMRRAARLSRVKAKDIIRGASAGIPHALDQKNSPKRAKRPRSRR